MRAGAITLAKIIYSTKTVDDTTLMSLGLLPRADRIAPIPVPGTPPQVEVLSVSRTAPPRFACTISNPSVAGCRLARSRRTIYTFVGETAPPDCAGGSHFEGPTTRAHGDDCFSRHRPQRRDASRPAAPMGQQPRADEHRLDADQLRAARRQLRGVGVICFEKPSRTAPGEASGNPAPGAESTFSNMEFSHGKKKSGTVWSSSQQAVVPRRNRRSIRL